MKSLFTIKLISTVIAGEGFWFWIVNRRFGVSKIRKMSLLSNWLLQLLQGNVFVLGLLRDQLYIKFVITVIAGEIFIFRVFYLVGCYCRSVWRSIYYWIGNFSYCSLEQKADWVETQRCWRGGKRKNHKANSIWISGDGRGYEGDSWKMWLMRKHECDVLFSRLSTPTIARTSLSAWTSYD